MWFFLDAVGPMMEALGVSEVRALSAGIRVDAPDTSAELSFAALVPTKRGAVTLVDGPARPFTPPAFVGADTSGLSVMRINFADLPRIAREVVAAMPDDERAEFQAQLDFVLMQAEPILTSLGSELITVERIERPFSATSKRSVYAVPTRDPDAVSNALAVFGQMIGLEARDFQGNQIWQAEFPPLSLGIGFGHIFIGDAQAVESALREAGAPDAPKLADEPRFTRAMRALGREGIGFSFKDTRSSMEHAAWTAANMERVMLEQLRSMGFDRDMDPEMYDNILNSMRENQPESLALFPPPEDIVRHMGDTASEMRSTPEGFTARWIILRPGR